MVVGFGQFGGRRQSFNVLFYIAGRSFCAFCFTALCLFFMCFTWKKNYHVLKCWIYSWQVITILFWLQNPFPTNDEIAALAKLSNCSRKTVLTWYVWLALLVDVNVTLRHSSRASFIHCVVAGCTRRDTRNSRFWRAKRATPLFSQMKPWRSLACQVKSCTSAG